MQIKNWLRFAPVSVLFLAALLLQGQKKPHTDAGRAIERGEYFFQRTCAACHSIGHYNRIAPDLLGITRRRDHEWLVRMIQRPAQLLNQQDPAAVALLMQYKVRMPDLRVSDAERDDLILYFEAQAAAHDKKPAAGNSGNTKAGARVKTGSSPN